MTIAAPLNNVAGKTTVKNSAVKAVPSGKPAITSADDKKIVPETIVPITVSTVAVATFWAIFFTANNKPKNTNAVMNLSMRFGS